MSVGGITINEMRAKLDLPPIEGGQEYLVPLSVRPATTPIDPMERTSALARRLMYGRAYRGAAALSVAIEASWSAVDPKQLALLVHDYMESRRPRVF